MAAVWILIVALQGWGTDGTGSKGNALDHIEFTSAERCEAAKKAVDTAWHPAGNDKVTTSLCVEK